MNKFVKTLIIINGIIIPIVLLTVFSLLIMEGIKNRPSSKNDINDGINIENKKVSESGDTVALQGIDYSTPNPIDNSTNYYIAIEAKTYEQPEIIYSSNSEFGIPPFRSSQNTSKLNYIFLDKNFNCLGKLVNKKASIMGYPISGLYNVELNTTGDTTVHYLAYLISFSDSNNDGLLNELDHHDLYLSDINGSNLTKVTSNFEIYDYSFVNNNKELFIIYKENTGKREEYKHNRFAVYNIRNKQLRLLTDIDENIKEVVNILNKS